MELAVTKEPASELAFLFPRMTAKVRANALMGLKSSNVTLRAIALFEAIKGIAALAAILGVLDLMHRDVRHLAIELIGRFGQNPDAHYPSIILHYADLLPDANVRSMVLLASGYILVRLLE